MINQNQNQGLNAGYTFNRPKIGQNLQTSIPKYPTTVAQNVNMEILNGTSKVTINEDEGKKVQGLSNSDVRKGFVVKVYSILSVQLILTMLMCAVTMTNQAIYQFQIQHTGIFWTCIVITMVILIIITCFPEAGRRTPLNYILLFVFTFGEGYLISFVCAAAPNPQMVIMAAAFTLATTLSLTLYACTTDTDVTVHGSLIFSIISAFFIMGLFLTFTQIRGVYIMLSAGLALMYGIYIVYDTQLIIGRGKLELTVDDYVYGALILYVDIIGLFLQILQILGEVSNSS